MVSHGIFILASRLVSFALGVLALALLVLVAHNWYLNRALARTIERARLEPPLEYDDQVNPQALQKALQQAGYVDRKPYKFLLLYFFRPERFQNVKSIKYGEALLQRHGDKGLQVFGITDAQPSAMRSLAEREFMSLPILFDKSDTLKLMFRISDSYEHTLLLTSDGKILFSLKKCPPKTCCVR
jgi:peroxiredoxin